MMPIEIINKVYKSPGKSKIPVMVEWKGERMIRGHSLQSSVKEIVRMVQSLDVVKINIVGNPGTGKTTFALALSHLIHKLSEKDYKVPFAVKLLTKNELLDFENTINSLEPVNWILIFDDVSFIQAIASTHKIETIKQKFTEIRHLQEADVKFITIFNFHYTLGLNKYLRQSNFAYYTSVGSSEMDNMLKIVGTQYTKLLLRFQKYCNSGLIKGKFSVNLGSKDKWFTYKYRDPFIPLLFHNTEKLRMIVSPKREWIDKFCMTCHKFKDAKMKDGIDVKDFAKSMDYKFGDRTARSAVKVKLFQNGMNVYPKRVKRAMKYLDEHMSSKIINLEELAQVYDLKDERTRLDK